MQPAVDQSGDPLLGGQTGEDVGEVLEHAVDRRAKGGAVTLSGDLGSVVLYTHDSQSTLVARSSAGQKAGDSLEDIVGFGDIGADQGDAMALQIRSSGNASFAMTDASGAFRGMARQRTDRTVDLASGIVAQLTFLGAGNGFVDALGALAFNTDVRESIIAIADIERLPVVRGPMTQISGSVLDSSGSNIASFSSGPFKRMDDLPISENQPDAFAYDNTGTPFWAGTAQNPSNLYGPPNGIEKLIGDTGRVGITALVADTQDCLFAILGTGEIYEINRATAAPTFVSNLSHGLSRIGNVKGADYDELANRMLFIALDVTYLLSDVSTGVSTPIDRAVGVNPSGFVVDPLSGWRFMSNGDLLVALPPAASGASQPLQGSGSGSLDGSGGPPADPPLVAAAVIGRVPDGGIGGLGGLDITRVPEPAATTAGAAALLTLFADRRRRGDARLRVRPE